MNLLQFYCIGNKKQAVQYDEVHYSCNKDTFQSKRIFLNAFFQVINRFTIHHDWVTHGNDRECFGDGLSVQQIARRQ